MLMLLGINTAMAEDEMLKPFVLASKGPGTVAAKTEAAKTALTANGFTIVGTYSPYPAAMIIIVTNDELKKNAAESEHGGFGAAQRVAITKVKNEVQVSYTNPFYMANAYRMKGDLKNIYASLEKALGKVEEYGGKGATANKMRKYHYMFGMEYFDDTHNVLVGFWRASHQRTELFILSWNLFFGNFGGAWFSDHSYAEQCLLFARYIDTINFGHAFIFRCKCGFYTGDG